MNISARASIECRRLTVSVPGRVLVRELDVTLSPGKVIAVLGRNGAGKSSLLHALAGLRLPDSGTATLFGRATAHWPRREFARHVALLPQSGEDPFPGTVLETALVGRHPHIEFWQWESESDRSVAGACLAATDLEGLEERDVATLSGGERRRLAIATVLAQEPEIYLLDEPIQQLDPLHELGALRLFRARADAGACVVMSLHDPGLAARFADESLLLFGDGRWLCGPTAEVLDPGSIQALYGIPVRELRWQGGRTFVPE
jgi:iron complex transport system ATP-binding protein